MGRIEINSIWTKFDICDNMNISQRDQRVVAIGGTVEKNIQNTRSYNGDFTKVTGRTDHRI